MSDPITSCFIRPYYERNTLCHWEVLLNPVHICTGEQIRSGHIQCNDIAMFDDEQHALDFVRRLKAENPELVELAVVPSICPVANHQEA